MSEPVLYMWTVYDNPDDYPGKWVVRRFSIYRPDDDDRRIVEDPEPMIVADSLLDAQRVIPAVAYCLGRHPDDDPAIYEVWA